MDQAELDAINAEPRRITIVVIWYEHGEPYLWREGKEFANAEELFALWQALPDDGFQATRYFFNHRNESNGAMLGASLSGCDWYWLTPEIIFGGDTGVSPEEIASRYKGASIKRGKWTTPDNIQRINEELGRWR